MPTEQAIDAKIETGRALCLHCGRHRLSTVLIKLGSIHVRICEKCFADLIAKLTALTY